MNDTVDQSVEEDVEKSLAEDLESVMASLDEPEEKEPEIEDEVEPEVGEEPEKEAEEEIEDEVEPEAAESEEDESEAKIEAPEHWAAADREIFEKQSPESQQWLLDRHKAMEGDYTRKNQELSTIRRRSEAVDDALDPYREEFSQAGLDDAGAIRQLASWHASLRSNPKEAIQKLATMYGADLTQTEEVDEFADPAIAAVQKELQEMKQMQSRNEQQAQQTQQEKLRTQIQDFEEAKDESGSLKHPHFQAVYEDMTTLIKNGLAKGLDDAYTKATAWHPELKQAQVETPKAEQSPAKPDRAAKVKKAKKAASGVKSSGASSGKSNDISLRDEIAALVG